MLSRAISSSPSSSRGVVRRRGCEAVPVTDKDNESESMDNDSISDIENVSQTEKQYRTTTQVRQTQQQPQITQQFTHHQLNLQSTHIGTSARVIDNDCGRTVDQGCYFFNEDQNDLPVSRSNQNAPNRATFSRQSHNDCSRNESVGIMVDQPTGNSSQCSRCGRWLCRLLHLCNTFAVLILSVLVGFLFVQVQMLQRSVSTEDKLIQELQEQLQTQQASQQHLTQRVNKEHSFTMYQLAGTFTLLTCLITMFHMTQHLSNWNEPVIQRKVVAILWMSPIYSVTSWLSLVFIQSHGYLAVIKDLYEALVIYSFLSFLIAVLGRGDRNVAITVLSYHADHLQKPARCFTSCYHPPPSESDQAKAAAVLLECQIWAMQFVLIRPFTSILHFVLEQRMKMLNDTNGVDSNDNLGYFKSPLFAIDMLTNVSVFFAFHGLLKFYHTVHRDLEWCKPFSKFMTVKGIVFLTFWQGLLISILCNINQEQQLQNSHSTSFFAWTEGSSSGSGNRILAEVASVFANETLNPKATFTNSTSFNPGELDHPNNNFNHSDTVINDPANSGSGGSSGMYDAFTLNPTQYESGDNDSQPNSSHNAREQAAMIQNFLICLEMLFFTIAHWCVFPAEEWEQNYRPQQMAKPGIGLKDLASDISYIVHSSSSARAYNRQLSIRQKATKRELLHQQAQNDDGEADVFTGTKLTATVPDQPLARFPAATSTGGENNGVEMTLFRNTNSSSPATSTTASTTDSTFITKTRPTGTTSYHLEEDLRLNEFNPNTVI